LKGLAELKNKVVNAPHVNIFKVATWTTMGALAIFFLIYIFVGDEIFNFSPILILIAFYLCHSWRKFKHFWRLWAHTCKRCRD